MRRRFAKPQYRLLTEIPYGQWAKIRFHLAEHEDGRQGVDIRVFAPHGRGGLKPNRGLSIPLRLWEEFEDQVKEVSRMLEDTGARVTS